jgi:uncharacterized protein YabN with tetrapyrrole methylase and pyrophosphatase domain
MTINKFKHRYKTMEQQSAEPLRQLSKERLNDLWEEAKVLTRKKPAAG